MKYDGTALTTQGFQPLACKLAQWCTVPLSRLIIEMAMLGPFLRVPSNFEIFHERLVSGRWLMRKSHYCLRFGGMMRWTMMRLTIWNGYAQPMFAFSDLSRPRCCRSLNVLLYPPPPSNNEVVWGLFWFHSVRLSRLPCPLCYIYSSGWILSILATNYHYHERVCRTQWPLTLTYIFKVIRPWLRKSCPLCSVYSSGWILFIFGTNDHYC